MKALLHFFLFDSVPLLIIGVCIYSKCSSVMLKAVWALLFTASLYLVLCSG